MTPQSEIAQEAQIKEAGCNAPRLTPADIDKVIVDVTFAMLLSEKCMVCEITLQNGFTVLGESSVVSKENFREDLGREYSYKKARDQIWQLEAYLLQQRLFEASK